jgi:hypothetical protein
LGIGNDGVSGVPGVLGAYAEPRDGKVKVGENLNAGQAYSGKVRHTSLLQPPGLDGKDLRLSAEIQVKGVSRPVRWACREAIKPDGS